MNTKSMALAVLLIFGAAACQNEEPLPQNQDSYAIDAPSPINVKMGDLGNANARKSGSAITSKYLDAINEALASTGVDFRVAMAEYIKAAGSEEAGNEVVSKIVGNKQLDHDFVPNDSRRAGWSGPGTENDITYAIDQVFATPHLQAG